MGADFYLQLNEKYLWENVIKPWGFFPDGYFILVIRYILLVLSYAAILFTFIYAQSTQPFSKLANANNSFSSQSSAN